MRYTVRLDRSPQKFLDVLHGDIYTRIISGNSLAIRREKSAGGYGAVGDNCRINLGIQDYFSACIRGKKHGLDLGQIRTAGKGHH